MRRSVAVGVCIALVVLLLPIPRGAAQQSAPRAAIFFVSDGMRPDLVERYAQEGTLPVMAALMRRGVRGDNGLLPAFPPNTGVGWTTLATGAWTGIHGSTNNTFHQTGTEFVRSTSAFGPGVVLAETLAEAAERAGKRVLFIEWPASRNYKIKGPAIDFRTFYSRRGVITTFDPPTLDRQFVQEFGLVYARVALSDASGWTGVLASERPARETTLTIPSTSPLNPERRYVLYLFDSTADGRVNYDRVLIATEKDGTKAAAILTPGEFTEIKVRLTDGRTAGFWLKVLDMTPDLSRFRLYFTSVARITANDPALEEQLAATFPTSTAADFAPLEAGIVDEETYVEQGLLWETAHWPVLQQLVTTTRPDLLFLGFPMTDEFSHQFMALVTPGAPVFDDANRDGHLDGRVAARDSFIRRAYQGAERTLALAMRAMPRETVVFVSSDHGFAATWKAINAGVVLQQAGLQERAQARNCVPASPTDRAKACWAGGAVQVYLNVKGRDNPGVVDPAEVDAVRKRVVEAFARLRDGDQPVIDRIFIKEELARVRVGDTVQTIAHSARTGDVVLVARPPYQFDAATPEKAVADAPFFGQHGFWPDLVDLRRNINMRSVFIAAGPGIVAGEVIRGVAMVDLAPTIAALLRIPPPANNQGRILKEILSGP